MTQPPTTDEVLLTRQQTADALGVSVRRVDQLWREGKLDRIKNEHTGAVRFRRSRVRDLQRQRRAFTPNTPQDTT